jgi:hypothetical protein
LILSLACVDLLFRFCVLTLSARRRVATGSTYAMSPNGRVSFAAASPRTPPPWIYAAPRSTARSGMRSQSHSAAGIIVQCIAHATSARGGSKPALTRSSLLTNFGRRRREVLPQPHAAAVSSDPKNEEISTPQRRRMKLAYRIFPASGASSGEMLEHRGDMEI